MKHEPYTHGEIVERLEQLDESSTTNLVLALCATAITILALAGSAEVEKGIIGIVARIVYLGGAVVVALMAIKISRKHKRRKA